MNQAVDSATFADEARPAAAVQPGRLLRQARQQRGWSMDQLAQATRLGLSTLNALERDDFRALGQPVYARGYYRKCAVAMAMDADALVQAYEMASGTDSPVPEIRQRPSIRYREGPGLVAYLSAGLLLASLFGGAAWWVLQNPDYRVQSRVDTGEAVANGEVLDRPAEPEAAVRTTASAAGVDEANPEASAAPEPAQAEPVTGQSAPVGVTNDAAASVAASAGPPQRDVLRLVVSEDSWVEITDDGGNQLLYKLLPAGTQRELQGVPPYTVYLGYAPGVEVFLDGRPVRFGDRIDANATAQFRLGHAR